MSSWIIVTTAVIGAVVILPFIMGLFGGNKFQVEGKVRSPIQADRNAY
jgi:hypothetical protein